MNNYDKYIHQLHENLQLMLRIVSNRPDFFKKFLRDMDTNKTQIQQKQTHLSRENTPKDFYKKPTEFQFDIKKSKKIPIEKAIKFLENNFTNIKSVEQWSDAMGYSKSYFWRKFEAYFKQPPQTVFIDKKKVFLLEFIKQHNKFNNAEAARSIHLRDGNGLYQFVKRNFDCTPTELKEKVQEE